jgi:hypothetical protein
MAHRLLQKAENYSSTRRTARSWRRRTGRDEKTTGMTDVVNELPSD